MYSILTSFFLFVLFYFSIGFSFLSFFENLFFLFAGALPTNTLNVSSSHLLPLSRRTCKHTQKSPQLGVEQEAGALPNSFSLSFLQFQKNISCNLRCVILCFTCSYFWTPKPNHSLCFVSVVHVGLSLSIPFPLHHLVCLRLFFLHFAKHLPRTHKTQKKKKKKIQSNIWSSQIWFGIPSLHWFLHFNIHT